MRHPLTPIVSATPKLVDVGAHPTPLQAYVLRPVASCTIEGFFLNSNGEARWAVPQQSWLSTFNHSFFELWAGNSGTAGVTASDTVNVVEITVVASTLLTLDIAFLNLTTRDGQWKGYSVWAEDGTAQGQLRVIETNDYSSNTITLESAFDAQATAGDTVNIGRINPGVVGFIGLCSTDLYVNYTRSTINGSVGTSPTSTSNALIVPAGIVAFGRVPNNQELISLVGGSSGSSGSLSATPGDPSVNLYCVVGSGATVSLTLEAIGFSGNTVAIKTLTVSTTAKSIEAYWSTGWSNTTFARLKVIAISGGTIYFNSAGNGIPGTNNGCISGLEPTSSNAEVLSVGDIL